MSINSSLDKELGTPLCEYTTTAMKSNHYSYMSSTWIQFTNNHQQEKVQKNKQYDSIYIKFKNMQSETLGMHKREGYKINREWLPQKSG